MRTSQSVTAEKLAAILAKAYDKLTSSEKAMLLSLFKVPEVRSRASAEPISRLQLKAILAKPLRQLDHDERATLAAFYGTMSIKRFLLEEEERDVRTDGHQRRKRTNK